MNFSLLSSLKCGLGVALLALPGISLGQKKAVASKPAAQVATAPEPATSGAGTAVLTGRVSGKGSDTVAVSLRENPLDPRERIVRTTLNDKGEFRLTVPVTGATKADLVYGEAVSPLFLDAGTDIEVRFKASDMENSLKFRPNDVPKGFSTKVRNGSNLNNDQRHRQQAANANNYLVEADAEFVENDGFQVLPDNIQLYEAPFTSFLDYRRNQQLNFLQDHSEDDSFTPEFYNYAHAEIIYGDANDRLTFQDLREQVVNTEGRMKMSPDYYNFLNDPKLLNSVEAEESELYHEFLINYVHFAAAQANHKRADQDFYPASYALAAKQLTGATRAIVLGRVMQESFRFGHVRQSAAMLADFKRYDPKNSYYPTLKTDFDQHKGFAIGAPAPDFALTTATGDTVHLHDYAGKLVYLNFWKSTNGLCLRDLAYAKDLIGRFQNKNIVFVNVALDENEQAWRQLVLVKKMPGVQARASGGLRSALAQAYSLQDIPTYMLLGEDGTFLNIKPKRMSSHAAIEEINQSFGKAGTYSSVLQMPK